MTGTACTTFAKDYERIGSRANQREQRSRALGCLVAACGMLKQASRPNEKEARSNPGLSAFPQRYRAAYFS
jgi:hypothetical protein